VSGSPTSTGPTGRTGPSGSNQRAAPAATRSSSGRDGSLDRRTVVLSAVLLAVAIVGGTALVATLADDGPARDPAEQLTDEAAPRPRIIPRPNEGRAPEEPGDRGGWAQLTLLGLIVVSLAGIAVVVVRGSGAARARRAEWRAAADSGVDGALDRPR
jgi:hypothetical protein